MNDRERGLPPLLVKRRVGMGIVLEDQRYARGQEVEIGIGHQNDGRGRISNLSVGMGRIYLHRQVESIFAIRLRGIERDGHLLGMKDGL